MRICATYFIPGSPIAVSLKSRERRTRDRPRSSDAKSPSVTFVRRKSTLPAAAIFGKLAVPPRRLTSSIICHSSRVGQSRMRGNNHTSPMPMSNATNAPIQHPIECIRFRTLPMLFALRFIVFFSARFPSTVAVTQGGVNGSGFPRPDAATPGFSWGLAFSEGRGYCERVRAVRGGDGRCHKATLRS